MAMTDSVAGNEQLDTKAARRAGLVCLLLGLVGVAGLLVEWIVGKCASPAAGIAQGQVYWAVGISFVLAMIWSVAALQLIKLRPGAQVVLVILNLLALIVATCLFMSLAATPEAKTLGLADWQKTAGLIGSLVWIFICAVVQVMLVKSSSSWSRLRYATVVPTAIAAAIAALVAINVIAQGEGGYWRKDVETLGSYRLSDRTKQVLQASTQPLRITCLYTSDSSDKGKIRGSEYSPQVMDLLNEMHEYNPNVRVVDASTNAQKAKVVDGLREKLAASSNEQVAFLKKFQQVAPMAIDQMAAQQKQWAGMSGKNYLNMWGISPELARYLGTLAAELKTANDKLARDMNSPTLPDYAKEAKEAGEVLTKADKDLGDLSKVLEVTAGIPKNVEANAKGALAEVAKAQAAFEEMCADMAAPGGTGVGPVSSSGTSPASAPAGGAAETHGQDGRATEETHGQDAHATPSEKDMTAIFTKLAKAAGKASGALAAAQKALDDLGGEQAAKWVHNAPSMTMEYSTIGEDGSVQRHRSQLADFFEFLAGKAGDVETECQGLNLAKTQVQLEGLEGMRAYVAPLRKAMAQAGKAAEQATKVLAAPDAETAAIFAQGHFFGQVREDIASLAKESQKLPAAKVTGLTDELSKDNILIIEAGDNNVQVVPFEDVWPLKVASANEQAAGGKEKRIFNGDAVIASKILSMTQKPFATVMITYFQPTAPEKMARMMPQSAIPAASLATLKARLQEANFEVKEWNLSQDMPVDTPTTGPGNAAEAHGQDAHAVPPKVLLVLPAPSKLPPQMAMVLGEQARDMQEAFGGMGPEHMARLQKAIDSGTPAIFLTGFMPEMPTPFGPAPADDAVNSYLQKDWGVTPKNDFRVVEGVQDESQPGKFMMNAIGIRWWPLSNFSDHPIGKPLQGRRVYWCEVCPVEHSDKAGVKVTPLLSVPEGKMGVWATNNLEDLGAKIQAGQGSSLSPGPQDMKPPFDVGVVATRSGEKESRIVVLGIGESMVDEFVSRGVPVLKTHGGSGDVGFDTSDAPRADTDVIVNSVYWLSGRYQYIAAGAAQAKPIAMMPLSTLHSIELGYLLVLPALVLVVGGIVMVVRKRS
jgi:hypothetical protein